MRGLSVLVLGALLATAAPAGAEIRDLGTFGPTCALPPPTAPPGRGVRLPLPERPPEAFRVRTRLPLAPGLRQQQVLRSPALLAAGTTGQPIGGPRWTLAFVGTDAESLRIIRGLPPGSGVYLLAMDGWRDIKAVEERCAPCLVQPGSDAIAYVFGVRRYPALVEWTGRELVITEGP